MREQTKGEEADRESGTETGVIGRVKVFCKPRGKEKQLTWLSFHQPPPPFYNPASFVCFPVSRFPPMCFGPQAFFHCALNGAF